MASDNPDWRASLGFADRLGTVVKMHVGLDLPSVTAYRLAYPTQTPAEANQACKVIESEVYNYATSRDDYDTQCKALLHDFHLKAKERVARDVHKIETPNESEEECPEGGLDIGKYKGAVHHANGLFSEVYRAKRPSDAKGSAPKSSNLPKYVALKVTVPSVMVAPHNAVREARMLQIAKSSNVISLLETFEQSGGRFILVFPFMRYDLAQLMREQELSPADIKSCLRDMFRALDHIHNVGIIHRDVKPSNLLLDLPSGPAYLADFGIAWCVDDPASEPGDSKITDVGTTSYRPPELLFGNTAYDDSLDMWAAGCVVAEVANGSSDTLFDSGDLGSELALIQSIFKSLGTPNLQAWPEAAQFPDWGKMQFVEHPPKSWAELLPNASDDARDLVNKLIRYQSSDRLTAAEVLKHPYFTEETN